MEYGEDAVLHAEVSTANYSEQSDTRQDQQPEGTESKVIKSANYRFRVNDVVASTRNIELVIQKFHGFVADMNQTSHSDEISNTMVIRVPSKDFENLLEALGKESTYTDFKRIIAQDVTEEFVDIQSRLRTKKEVRDRYIDILKNKAKTVEDVLKAEEQIRILQEEIEAKEGRLKYLQSRVAMSTVNLEIYQLLPYKESPGTYKKPYIVKAQQAFINGWELVTGIVLIGINIWPLLLIGILVLWKGRWLKEKLFK